MLTTLLSPDSGTMHIAGVDLSTSPEEVRRLDLHPTPGCSNERVRIFLARELTPTGRRDHQRRGRAGLLATARAREQGWATLRPADTPWPSLA